MQTFECRIEQLRDFTAQHGRLPVERKDRSAQSQLARWLRGQRERFLAARLSFPAMVALDRAAPGWRQISHRNWDVDLRSCLKFISEHGAPEHSGSRPGEERIAFWLKEQLGTRTSPSRISRLNAEIPGWRRLARRSAGMLGFRARMNALIRWRKTQELWPTIAGSTPEERDLAWWLTAIRQQAERGELTEARKALLDERLVGWDQQLYPRYIRPIRALVQQIAEFTYSYGRLPTHGAQEAFEVKLGNALNRARRAYRAGRLHDDWLLPLEELVPTWRGRLGCRSYGKHQDFEARVTELAAFVDEHGRWPRIPRRCGRVDGDPVEASLAFFIMNARARRHQSRLSADHRETLDRLLPGWHVVSGTNHHRQVA